ncbi:transaldolase [Candidatus Gottesmanbacteria bacterium]|nr:transaldolase [Candidatus Gottesmanbacteria bacterium]
MNLSTKIFLDGGSVSETKEADTLLRASGLSGLDGQTTNPSLIVKNLVSSIKNLGGKISEKKATEGYKKTVQEMAKTVKGPISIQVIGDTSLTVDQMLSQARDRLSWIPNAVIKFPCTEHGLAAAEIFCEEGSVNITLLFSQAQAAAVYAATKRANYDVYVSPFVGRLDDRGENGMDVVANILSMYHQDTMTKSQLPMTNNDHFHSVNVLAASIRSVKQLQYALFLKSDVATVPFKVLKEWLDPLAESKGEKQLALPGEDFIYDAPGLLEIPYEELSLDEDWKIFDLHHDLTDAGVTKFWEDWKSVVE